MNYTEAFTEVMAGIRDNSDKMPQGFIDFANELVKDEGFKKSLISVIMKTLERANNVMTEVESEQEALTAVSLPSINKPLMQFAYICFEMGKKNCEAKSDVDQLEKMFNSNMLDTQESV